MWATKSSQPKFRQPANRTGSHFIQGKLKVGKPGDKYEQEADRVADTVMRMPDNPILRQPAEEEEEMVQMQPLEEEEEMQMQPMEEEEDQLQMQPMEEEEELQMKLANQQPDSQNTLAPEGISRQLQSSRGAGELLPPGLQREMAQKMGGDFSDVAIHTDDKAVQMNRELGAKAFTHGSDIYFNQGQYSPESSEGKHLLAHELTHVVQQEGGLLGGAAAEGAALQRKVGSVPRIQTAAGTAISLIGVVVSATAFAAGQKGKHPVTVEPRKEIIAARDDPKRQPYREAHPFKDQRWTFFKEDWERFPIDEEWQVSVYWQYNGAELTDVHMRQRYHTHWASTTHAKLIMIDNQADPKRVGFRCEFEWDASGIGHIMYRCEGWISADGSAKRTPWTWKEI